MKRQQYNSKKILFLFTLVALVLPGCTTNQLLPMLANRKIVYIDQTRGDLNYDKLKKEWSIGFSLPDPLFEPSRERGGSISDLLQSGVIRVQALLVSDQVSEAWIKQECQKDSLSPEQCANRRNRYTEEHNSTQWFRISLYMQVTSPEHSLDPNLWAIFLTDDEGIMYEPVAVRSSPVTRQERKIYSEYHNLIVRKTELSRIIDLYFTKTTFFGKQLLSDQTKYLKLTFSYQKRTVEQIAWILAKRSVRIR